MKKKIKVGDIIRLDNKDLYRVIHIFTNSVFTPNFTISNKDTIYAVMEKSLELIISEPTELELLLLDLQ